MIDSHAHYDDERFDGDRETLLESLFSSGGITHIINAATDIPSCKGLEALSGRYEGLYHTVGITRTMRSRRRTDMRISCANCPGIPRRLR